MLLEMIFSELQILQQSSHANIIRVHEILQDNENYYIVTDFLVGGDYFQRLKKMKKIPEQKASFLIK